MIFYSMLLLLSGFLAGCVHLPLMADFLGQTHHAPVIVDRDGKPFPQEETRRILRGVAGPGSEEHLQQIVSETESICGTPFIAGNKVTLLVDPKDSFAAMLGLVQEAKDTVNIETFILKSDSIGYEFADLLIQKQKSGVQVNMMYDSLGSLQASSTFLNRLRRAGVRLLEFHPVNPFRAFSQPTGISRDHRKILVVDGVKAVIGSINIARLFLPNQPGGDKPWRETNIQIEGPAVAELQRYFLENWSQAGGKPLPPKDFFPALKAEGDKLVQIIANSSGAWNREIYMMYVAAFTWATRSIHVSNSYFVPDRQIVDALISAARQGVDVQLVVPGRTDYGSIWRAGRTYYPELLRSGVKIYERSDTVLHAKTAVIDGIWSTVGSTNLEMWSLFRDDEINAVILGGEFAAELERLFARDVAESNPITMEMYKKWSWGSRFAEWLLSLFAPAL